MKKFIGFALAMFICFVFANCASKIEWNYDSETCTLYITGRGKISDYNSKETPPWAESEKFIDTLKIENGITRVGNNAFSAGSLSESGDPENMLGYIGSVDFADSVTEIGDEAFYNWDGLQSLKLPPRLTFLGEAAFSDCYCLTSVSVPGSLKVISEKCFEDCSNMNKLELGNGIEEIKNDAFSGEYELSEVCFPTSIKKIGDDAFWFCGKLTEVIIPEGCQSIGKRSFEFCGLESITIPKSVTEIGDNAFGYGRSNREISTLDGKIESFVIKGYKNTAAEKYAKDNGFTFEALD